MQRKTVNLIGSTAADLDPFLADQTKERSTLEELVDEDLDSESDVLRALVKLGMRYVREYRDELGYREWAENWTDEDEKWLQASMEMAAARWKALDEDER